MPEEEKKPQYFSNSDFEKVAADIISSPRRGKSTAPDSMDVLFKITRSQQEYYTKCFRHLIKTTQGKVDLNGALCGGDQRIIAFFKRSSLDVASLSRIWTLADVNEDGWLNLAEFSIAMHLVVLRVKGEIPIPEELPAFAIPAMTPPISGGPCSGNPSSAPTSTWLSETDAEHGQTVTDGAGIRVQPVIKQFSNTPPLLVDSRPTAIKHSALLALKSPLGPPPIPPNRPNQRGHNRSASLDLKLIAMNKGKFSTLDGKKALVPPTSLSLWTSNSDPTTTAVTENNLTSSSSPRSPQTTTISTTTTTFASFPGTPDSINANNIQPPPIPQRISPSPLPKVVEEPKFVTIDEHTQTDEKIYTESELQKFLDGFGSKLDDLLGEEIAATEGTGVDRWSKRCEALRQQNAELESERARLAQVRIQLELRLQEFEERNKKGNSE